MLNFLMIVFAKYLFLLVIVISVIFFLTLQRPKQKKLLIFAAFYLPLAYIISKIASLLYYDPRPFVIQHFTLLVAHAANNGFPSDHALLSFTLASLVFVFNRKWGLLLFFISILVGISRVYVGTHSSIDILGSFIISVVSVFLVDLFLKRQKNFDTKL